MPEVVLAVGGILVCAVIYCFSAFVHEESPIVFFLGAVVAACGFVYFVTRLVHWAWETPIPFSS